MIECIFTLDYEIYGNGAGSLKDLVYDPAQRLREIFEAWNARFVVFVEVAELERIEACGTDPAINLVRQQIRTLYREGFEIGFHLHPQWANARYDRGRWVLDYSEYSLCTLPWLRITRIVERSLDHLRYLVDQDDFAPLSFRAGNWLFQPTQPAAAILAQHGIRVDSSVFKGGRQSAHRLDYRPALQNGYYWRFDADANVSDPMGSWTEVPIYTELVPSWKMLTSKRLSFKSAPAPSKPGSGRRLNRLLDLMRFRYPLKLDFCRMTLDELTTMMEGVIQEDHKSPESLKPIVAIGHTKDFGDAETVDAFLAFLHARRIPIQTFENVYLQLRQLSAVVG